VDVDGLIPATRGDDASFERGGAGHVFEGHGLATWAVRFVRVRWKRDAD
jgi:hypothetical protein